MPRSQADRNLLFGILALQMDFISRDALIVAMNAWVLEKSKSLGLILVAQKALTADVHALLEALVQKHLALHGNNAEKSLAAVSSVGSLRKDLENIADPEVQASLVHVSAARAKDDDPYATASVGIPTSAGTRFHILRPHAKGGLGEVFVALDSELNREVALKEIQDKHADNLDSRARFLLEAEITGGLEHPSIVPVYGLGTYADGRPFYAMRFIRGDSLHDAIKRFHENKPKAHAKDSDRNLELHKLLRRLIDVCNALQYAHDRGVLHRDIKPGNIMLGKYGETLVVDWGLAKATGNRPDPEISTKVSIEPPLHPANASGSAETVAGSAIGTPAYMSPEQAEGRLDILGPATDVYSLGATLYNLLTGKAPAEGTLEEVLKKVRTGDITPPRRVDLAIDSALEAVCMKAMALRPGDRYPSLRQMSNDLEHWLAGEPVSAWPEPMTIKLRRWVSRHKPLVSAAAALVLAALPLLMVLFVLSEGARVDLENEQGKTKDALVDARQQKVLADDNAALALKNEGLAKKNEEAAEERREQAEQLAIQVQFNQFYARQHDEPGVAVVGTANLLPEASRLKNQSLHESIRLHLGAWLRESHRLKAVIDDHRPPVFSLDGKIFCVRSGDNDAQLWETATRKPLGPLLRHNAIVTRILISPDGKYVLTTAGQNTQIWEVSTGKPRTTGMPFEHGSCLAFSPDGKRVLIGEGKSARLWDTDTGKPIGAIMLHADLLFWDANFSPDGKRVLTAAGKTAYLWNAATGDPVGVPMPHQSRLAWAEFSPDGATVLTSAEANDALDPDEKTEATAHLWKAATGRPIGASIKRDGAVIALKHTRHGVGQVRSGRSAVAFSPDGRRLLIPSSDNTARLWDTTTGKAIGVPLQHAGPVTVARFSPDGSLVMTGSIDATVRAWNPATGKPLNSFSHPDQVWALAFSQDSKRIVTGCADKTARLWEIASGRQIGASMQHPDTVHGASIFPDGKTLITGCEDGITRLWELVPGKELGTPLRHDAFIHHVSFGPDGKWCLVSGQGIGTEIWDVATGNPIQLSRDCFTTRFGMKTAGGHLAR